MGIEDEIIEIENYIKTLEINDETNKEVNKMIADGMSKGLIFDFIRSNYRGTMFSSKVIKQNKKSIMNFKNILISAKKKNIKNIKNGNKILLIVELNSPKMN